MLTQVGTGGMENGPGVGGRCPVFWSPRSGVVMTPQVAVTDHQQSTLGTTVRAAMGHGTSVMENLEEEPIHQAPGLAPTENWVSEPGSQGPQL